MYATSPVRRPSPRNAASAQPLKTAARSVCSIVSALSARPSSASITGPSPSSRRCSAARVARINCSASSRRSRNEVSSSPDSTSSWSGSPMRSCSNLFRKRPAASSHCSPAAASSAVHAISAYTLRDAARFSWAVRRLISAVHSRRAASASIRCVVSSPSRPGRECVSAPMSRSTSPARAADATTRARISRAADRDRLPASEYGLAAFTTAVTDATALFTHSIASAISRDSST